MNNRALGFLALCGLFLVVASVPDQPLGNPPKKLPKKRKKPSKTVKKRKKVQVYKNLNKDCYSVRDAKEKRVTGHANAVVLKNASFKVSEAGRQRVLKEKRKNVHAYVEGEKTNGANVRGLKPVTYDPYKYKTFVDKKTKKPIKSAALVVLKPDGVYAK